MRIVVPEVRRATSAPPRAAAEPASIDIRIDALVFHGFTRAEGRRAGAMLQRELERLVTAHGLTDVESIGSRARIDAGNIVAGGRPETTGRRAARALLGGLGS